MEKNTLAKRAKFLVFSLIFVTQTLIVTNVSGHGRLIEPPSRASMWRFGFDTPHDYNDHECYCGGFTRQWQRNKGNCGLCGDAWDMPVPRPHEAGGKYGTGVIARRYRTGSIIPVAIELTANHHGYFEFRICAMTFRNKEVTQDCLDKYLLRNDHGNTKFYPGPGNKIFKNLYKLPDDLTCAQCVFQWRYIAGNNWGDCGNGTAAVGCGPQEEFRACADVAIGDEFAQYPSELPEHPDENLIPDEIPAKPISGQTGAPHWLFNLTIASICLLFVLAALALLYLYYYHADRAKKWLMKKGYVEYEKPPPPPPPPVPFPRQKKRSQGIYAIA